jgi:hypothetical protein
MHCAKTANDVLVMVELRKKILAGSVFIVVKFCDCGYVSGAHRCAASVRQRRYLFLSMPSTISDAAGARTKRFVVDSFNWASTEAIK